MERPSWSCCSTTRAILVAGIGVPGTAEIRSKVSKRWPQFAQRRLRVLAWRLISELLFVMVVVVAVVGVAGIVLAVDLI